MKRRLIACLAVLIWTTTQAQTLRYSPSEAFLQAFTGYVHRLDANNPLDCLAKVRSELLIIDRSLSLDTTRQKPSLKALKRKIITHNRTCDIHGFDTKLSSQLLQTWNEAWIPWMTRSGWARKEGWTIFY